MESFRKTDSKGGKRYSCNGLVEVSPVNRGYYMDSRNSNTSKIISTIVVLVLVCIISFIIWALANPEQIRNIYWMLTHV